MKIELIGSHSTCILNFDATLINDVNKILNIYLLIIMATFSINKVIV